MLAFLLEIEFGIFFLYSIDNYTVLRGKNKSRFLGTSQKIMRGHVT